MSKSDERLLRRREVEHLTSLSRSLLYSKIQAGEFPKPIRISKQAVAWPASRVQAWIEEQIQRADAELGP